MLAGISSCTDSGSTNSTQQTDLSAQTPVTVIAPESCDMAGCVGEGIDTAAGAYTTTVEDLLFPGGLFGMELLRSYRSDRTSPGWFGSGWATVYETTLATGPTGITVNAPAGLAPRWRPEAPEGWTITGGVRVVESSADDHDIVWPTGEKWSFNRDGRMASMVSPYGQTITIEWSDGMPTAIRSSQGPTLQFKSSGGRIISVSTDDGRLTVYRYEGDSLTRSESPGMVQQYRYNVDQRMLELKGPSGTTSITYSSGKVDTQTTASGQRLVLRYDTSLTTVDTEVSRAYRHDAEGRLTNVTQSDRELLVREFDAAGRLVLNRQIAQPGDRVVSEVVREYDAGTLVKETTNDLVTTFGYDTQGRVIEVRSPDGATKFEYDSPEPLPKVADTAESGRQEFAYTDGFIVASTDATDVRTTVGRDALGNPTTRATGDQAAWSYSFDSEGNVLTTTSPSGRVWRSEWAPRSTLMAETDPAGRRSTTAYDEGGRVSRQTDGGGQSTRYEYDDAGRLSKETAPDGLVTTYTHGADGSLATTTLPGERVWRSVTEHLEAGGATVTATAPDGTMTISTMDSSGREIERRVLEADGTVVEQCTFEFEFDRPTITLVQRGNSRFETRITHDEAGHLATVTESLDGREVGATSYRYEAGRVATASANGTEASYRYDAAGRLIEVVSGKNTWTAEYTGGLLSATRHNGRTTTVGYDIDARATSFVDPSGVTTNWDLDLVARPKARSIGDATSTFEWSPTDQLVGYRAADGSKWSWQYDDAGRLTEADEPRGVVTSYEYENGVVTRISTEGGDRRDDRFSYDARGLLQRARTTTGEFTYAYDAAGLPTTIDGDGTERWSYDAQGNVIAIQSGSDSFNLSYDDGQLEAITGPKGSIDTTRGTDGLTSITATGRDPIRLLTNSAGQLSTVRWNERTAVDLDWSQDSTFLELTERGSDLSQKYTTRDGQLTSFTAGELQIAAVHQQNGYLESLRLDDKGKVGTVRFDETGRPVTLVGDDVSSTLSYDDEGRISSVLTSRPGKSPEQTTVTYNGQKWEVNGDNGLVDALFTEDGAQRSPLPSSLANPLAAASGVSNPSILDPSAASPLSPPEPRPLDNIAGAIQQATPTPTAPVGVKNLPRLAEQIAAAEIIRLAPTMKVNGETAVRLPIIDPKNGHLADFNPFTDAAPSGLALGALGRQSGDDSLFERARSSLGEIIGGIITVGTEIGRFVIDNPIARVIISVGSWGLATAACAGFFAACVPLAATAALIAAAESAQALVSATLGALHACSNSDLLRCGLNVALGGIAAVALIAVARVGGSLAGIYYAKRAYSAALASESGKAIASGAVGTARSDLLAALRFERVVAREVPVCLEQVCARLDSVTRDVFGRLRLVESKNGLGARFTENQQAVYPALRTGSGFHFPRGLAGNPEQTIVGRFEVQPWGGAGRFLGLP